MTDVHEPSTGSPGGAPADDAAARTALVHLISSEVLKLYGPGGPDAAARIRAVHDDLCDAMLHSVDTAPSDATAIAEGLLVYWGIAGARKVGREWCRRVAEATDDAVRKVRFALYDGQLARDDDDASAAAAVEAGIAAARALHDAPTVGLGLTILAPMAFRGGRMADAKQMASEALTILRRGGRPRHVVEVLNVLGNVATVEGDPPAAFAFYEDALAIAREAGMTNVVSRVLANLGGLSIARSNFDRAREYYTEAQDLALTLGDNIVASAALTNLGVIAKAQGDYPRARRLLDEALVLKRSLGDTRGTAIVLQGLADLDRFEGNDASAGELLRESLRASRTLDFSIGMISGLETFAALLANSGASEVGLRIAAAADAARTATGQRRSAEDTVEFDKAVAALRDAASEDEARTWWDEGASMSLADAVDRVLTLRS